MLWRSKTCEKKQQPTTDATARIMIVNLVFDRLIVGLCLLVVDKLTDGKIVLLGHLIENDHDEIV